MSDADETSSGKERSEHAEQREQEGRRTKPAFNDAQKARRVDLFVDTETGRYIVRGGRGREHVFEQDGELVTTVDRTRAAHLRRLRNGRIRELSDEEYEQFEDFFR